MVISFVNSSRRKSSDNYVQFAIILKWFQAQDQQVLAADREVRS